MRMPSHFQISYSLSALSKSALILCLAVAALSGCSWNPWKKTDPTPGAAGGAGVVTDANANAGVQATTKNRFVRFFSPYKIDIQQGNFVSSEMLAQLKEGMTREQVRFVLGTPLLTDIFHADRWDYDFRLAKGSGEVIASRVSVFFDGNTLTKWEGGNLPTESEYLGFIAGSKPALMPAISDGKPVSNPGLPGQ